MSVIQLRSTELPPSQDPPRHLRPRVMVYCHDGAGVGHLRRSLAICEYLKCQVPRACFLLATGTPHVPLFKLSSGIDYLKLPALVKRNDGAYHSKYLTMHMRQLWRCRQALLLTSVQYFNPDVLLMDKTPVGAHREMVPAIRWLQRNRPRTRVIFGMRDIEDEATTTVRQWQASRVVTMLQECFDEIWVYGMESIFDVAREYRLPDAVRGKLHYVGYFRRPPCRHQSSSPPRRNVLVTVGGGTDGELVLDGYLSSAAHWVAYAGGQSTVVGGPDLAPDIAARLRAKAAELPHTTWLNETHCMSCLMRKADLVVCMGGYNTMCEVVSLGRPALVVPRTRPRLEQAIRACRWEQIGLVRSMRGLFTREQLGEAVLTMLERPLVPDCSRLNMGALDWIGRRFEEWFQPGRVRS